MITSGVDIGSLSTKALVLEDGKIRGWALILTGADSVESANEVMKIALEKAGITMEQVQYTIATGYGRINVPFAQDTITELSCHARGNHWFFPQVRTILDMGGQDCKAIRCDENGKLTNFIMNDTCAAGTGRYLERAAATLGLELGQIGPLSLQTVNGPLTISSACAVFAETDIIRHMRNGKHTNDIIAGATESILGRVIALLERVGIVEALCVSGGVAKNVGVVRRLEERLGLKAHIASDPQIVGALGAALFAMDRANGKNPKGKE